MTKKKLCIFVHYFPEAYYPIYVQYFINELCLHFDELIMVTNRREIEKNPELLNKHISIQHVENEGYDFGMFLKVFQQIDPSKYDQIACINDSNILFNKLTTVFAWGKSAHLDFWGMIDSYQNPSSSPHPDSYHIQSHFLIFNKKAIELLPSFFKSIPIDEIFRETDANKLRELVVNHWEIGLSQFMLKNGLRIGSYFESKIYANLYLSKKIRNISRRLYAELIESGYPLIKKKVILDRKFRNVIRFKPSWKKLMRQYGNKDWEIEHLIHEMNLIRDRKGGSNP